MRTIDLAPFLAALATAACAPPPCTQESCALGEVCDASGRCVAAPHEGEGEGAAPGEGEGEGPGVDCSFGTFDPDASYVVAPLTARSRDGNAIGVASVDDLHAIDWQIDPGATSFHVRPTDGALLYLSGADSLIHVFTPDPLLCPFVDHTIDGVANDPVVDICGGTPLIDRRFFIVPDTGIVIANCSTTGSFDYRDETGAVVFRPNQDERLLDVGVRGVLLVATATPAVLLIDGATTTEVQGLPPPIVEGAFTSVFTRATPAGFFMKGFDINGNELFSVTTATAQAVSDGVYPIVNASASNGGLDAQGRIVGIQTDEAEAPIVRISPGGTTAEKIFAKSGDIVLDSLSTVFSGP